MKSASNPFASPNAPVADVGVETQEFSLFTHRGRLGRLRLVAYATAGYLVAGILAFSLGAASAALGLSLGFVNGASTVLGITYLAFLLLILIRRSHDMNMSGWLSVLALIPIINLIWLFKRGSPESNRFGQPPPPNGAGIHILVAITVVLLLAITATAYIKGMSLIQDARQATHNN